MKFTAVLWTFCQLSKCGKRTDVCSLGVHCKNHSCSPVVKLQCCLEHGCNYLYGSGEIRPGCPNAGVNRKTETYIRLGFACSLCVIGLGLGLYYLKPFPINECKSKITEKIDADSMYTRELRNNYYR